VVNQWMEIVKLTGLTFRHESIDRKED